MSRSRPAAIAGVVTVAAIFAFVAEPLQAETASSSGIGATITRFGAANRNGSGRPPVGATYYRIDGERGGRVSNYHVVVGWKSGQRSGLGLLTRLVRGLPSDAKAVRPYDGYCAIYRSGWLGKMIGLPYVIVYAPQRYWWNGVSASLNPKCRG